MSRVDGRACGSARPVSRAVYETANTSTPAAGITGLSSAGCIVRAVPVGSQRITQPALVCAARRVARGRSDREFFERAHTEHSDSRIQKDSFLIFEFVACKFPRLFAALLRACVRAESRWRNGHRT